MGHTKARVLVRSKDPSGSREFELLVDTGSTYTWINRQALQELGIPQLSVRSFKTIDGRLLRRDVGEAIIEFANERATRMIVFGEPGDAEVLGVDALEGLGLEVDPVTRQLTKTEALLALRR